MNQFKTILKFELKNYLKNKIFVGVTAFLVIVIAAVMFFPRVAEMFESDDGAGDTDSSGQVMLISAEDSDEYIREAFSNVFTDYDVRVTDSSLDEIKKEITSGEAECAFVFDNLTSYTYYVDDLSMYDQNTYTANDILKDVYKMTAMIGNGVPAEEAAAIMSVQIDGHTESLGKDQITNFFYAYVMIFALYMVILLYGQMVATNVASEKSSRAMEVLITSAKPVSMMFGKVIASCLAGLMQLICVFGSAFLFYNMNKSYWGGTQIVKSIFDMPLDLLLYMLLFFVLGFFIYAFMFGAVGSTASKLEDINTSSMPITMIFVAGFFIIVTTMSSGNIDSMLMRVCSYIPFTSPMAMFTRIVMSTVPAYEIAISAAILIVSVIGIGVISARIYRAGVLLYGTPPKLGTIIKMALRSERERRGK